MEIEPYDSYAPKRGDIYVSDYEPRKYFILLHIQFDELSGQELDYWNVYNITDSKFTTLYNYILIEHYIKVA